MNDIKCGVCNRFIGREVGDKLYDDKNNLLAEGQLMGYCIMCRNIVVWRSSGVISMAEASIPPATPYTPPVPEFGIPSLPIDEELPAKVREIVANNRGETVATAPIRLEGNRRMNKEQLPVGKPQILTPSYGANNKAKPKPVEPESKDEKPKGKPVDKDIEVIKEKPTHGKQAYVVFGDSKIYHSVDHYEDKIGTVVTDVTGYRLCKICDGFVKAGLVNE